MALKILHTADWQLGRSFGQLEPEASLRLRRQRFATVGAIAERAARERVDAVLVAGDIFEHDDASDRDTLHALRHAAEPFAGPWVLLPGNHDAATPGSILRRLQAGGSATGWDARWQFALEPSPILLAEGRLAILPAPLQRRHESDDLTEVWDTMPTPEGAVRVGLAHGSVTGFLPEGAMPHNPIAPDRAERARLDYLALGDWHGTRPINARTWYAGTPEPDSFDANDTGNVLLVTVPDLTGEHRSPPLVERIPIGHNRWTRIDATLSSEQDLDLLETRLQQLGPHFDRQVVWLGLTGALDLAACQRLDDRVDEWKTRLAGALRADLDIAPAPNEADLDAIATGGFVRTAIDHLRQLQISNSPEAPVAGDALRLLSVLDRRSRGDGV